MYAMLHCEICNIYIHTDAVTLTECDCGKEYQILIEIDDDIESIQ